ncbi:MAG: folylpolyglutamate synthase/dihydrofolate synthase family protein [Pseudomonadota bacterium]
MQGAPSDAILERLLHLHPKIIDLTLDRVWRLLAATGHPERELAPVIHVAGTNGKGSTVAMLRAGLEAAGGRVQAYTSPHLARFHERIRLAEGLIPEPALAALLEDCEEANDGAPITFFEITTVAALLAFARQPAEWVLLEVGLGGRLDATNVVDDPRLTVITPIDYDHQQYLGETIPEIAAEKAGILKPGVPCVVGRQRDAALEVIRERAEAVGAPLRIYGQDWMVRRERGRVVFEDEAGLLDLPVPRLPGAHQVENAGIAIAVLRALGLAGGPGSAARAEPVAEAALLKAEWPARMQRLTHGPLVERLPPEVELWLDGGHNASAGRAMAVLLGEMARSAPVPVLLVLGLLDTKDPAGYLAPLVSEVTAAATVTIPGTQASVSAEALAKAARGVGIPADPAASVDAALDAVLAGQTGPARVLICGSLYLAGEVLRRNG